MQQEPRVTSSLLAPLRSGNFALLWLAQAVALLGAQFYLVTQAWLVLQLTGSGFVLGTIFALAAVPRVLFLPVAGMMADKLQPKIMLLCSSILFTAVMSILGALVFIERTTVWHLAALALAFGTTSALYLPASFAILPSVVDRSWLHQANALIQMTNQAAFFIGPALAGLLIAAVGVGATYAIMAAASALAASLILALRVSPRAQAGTSGLKATLLSELREGLVAVKSRPLLLALISVSALVNLGMIGPLQVGLPALAYGPLHMGAGGLGLLLSIFAFGSLLGALAAGVLGQVRHRAWLAMAFGSTGGALWIILGWTSELNTIMIVLAATGLCVGVLNVLFVTLIQLQSPSHLLGRIMSIQLIGSAGLQPVSLLLSGWAIELAGPPVLFSVGAALVMTACLGSMALPAVRDPN